MHAEDEISDILAINLRQKPGFELPWTSIINLSYSATVNIDPLGVLPGDYSLVLESLDTNSSIPDLVLRTDTVTITVV